MFFADGLESRFTGFHRAAVAPYYSIAQYMLIGIHQHQAMHLVGNADSRNIFRFIETGSMTFQNGLLDIFPPLVRALFCPTGMNEIISASVSGYCALASSL